MFYMLGKIRKYVYLLGFRPRYGSVLHSPSLSYYYAFKDFDIFEAFKKGFDEGTAETTVKLEENNGSE